MKNKILDVIYEDIKESILEGDEHAEHEYEQHIAVLMTLTGKRLPKVAIDPPEKDAMIKVYIEHFSKSLHSTFTKCSLERAIERALETFEAGNSITDDINLEHVLALLPTSYSHRLVSIIGLYDGRSEGSYYRYVENNP
jgi:hypothetical protein